MRIEVIEQIDKHNREVWDFNAFEMTLVMVGKRIEEKLPRKRNWKVTAKFDRYNKRDSSLPEPDKIPNWVKIEAAEKMKSFIKVMTWDEWKR